MVSLITLGVGIVMGLHRCEHTAPLPPPIRSMSPVRASVGYGLSVESRQVRGTDDVDSGRFNLRVVAPD